MVNEERLHHMIKIAIFDTDQGKECKPMTQYARKDYVSQAEVLLYIMDKVPTLLRTKAHLRFLNVPEYLAVPLQTHL